MIAEDEGDHTKVVCLELVLVLCIESIIKVLLIIDKHAQIQRVEALKDIFPLLRLGAGPVCEGTSLSAEGLSVKENRSS